jgi:anti-sigma B factor antagonist
MIPGSPMRNSSYTQITYSDQESTLSIAESVRPGADPFAIPDGRVVVVLSGELDIAAVPVIREAFADAIGRAPTGVVGDLSRVSFIDACGLGALVGAANGASHLPGGLTLSGIPDHMHKLLRIAGLSDRFAAGLPPATLASPVRHAEPAGRNVGRARRRASTGVSLTAAAAAGPPAPSPGVALPAPSPSLDPPVPALKP